MQMIVKGDCRDILTSIENDSVDLVLTDPPYSISRDTGFHTIGRTMDFGEWDYEAIDLDFMSQHFYRVLRKGGTVIIWFDIWKITPLSESLTEAGFKMFRQIVWQKNKSCSIQYKYFVSLI